MKLRLPTWKLINKILHSAIKAILQSRYPLRLVFTLFKQHILSKEAPVCPLRETVDIQDAL